MSKNDFAWVEELRLMARVAKGDNIEGYSVGVAIKLQGLVPDTRRFSELSLEV
ncbi:hypothetical protein [Ruegeria arenilitoris]|uniref:hypothetical protein n=1 Tax=Ruegeria arenilitoris TaxID=1173585 RepID=UPI00147A75A5|nr:hypothetical protein [Ruegeria arenilitoris]